jgi:hypothetical protein
VHGHTHRHSTHKGAGQPALLIVLIGMNLPLDLDWARSNVHILFDWMKCYPNLGEVRICSIVRSFQGQRGLARTQMKNTELQTMQYVYGDINFDTKDCFPTIPPFLIYILFFKLIYH